MSEDWKSEDPFADSDDPAAREREERRLEREAKRREREAKDAEKQQAAEAKAREKAEKQKAKEEKSAQEQAAKAAAASAAAGAAAESAQPSPEATQSAQPSPEASASPPTPVPEQPTPPPAPPRTPEQEFWDEDPDPVAVEEPPTPEPAQRSWEFGDEGDPEMKGEGSGRGGRRHRGGFLGGIRRHPIAVIALIFVVLVIWFLFSLFQPFAGDGSGRVAVKVPKGASVSEVADLLEEKGVISGSTLFGIIDASTLFQMRVTLDGKRSDLYAGNFILAKDMSYSSAIDALSTPPVKKTTEITIPEGESRAQAAKLVAENGIPGKYMKATKKSKYLNPAEYGGKGAKNLEGFLFPDTFTLKPKAPVGDLVQLQLQDFKRRIKGVNMKYAKSKNLTIYDVLIIASMIEDEAGVKKDQKKVASVIYNRLHEGMPLGIDATIRFATGNYTKPLTLSETEVDSPYNTRTNQGLPPGPINSPGLAAINAAAHPAKTKFIYYVTDPKGCNELVFAKTEAEWQKDVERYEKAREANDGNQPSSCGE